MRQSFPLVWFAPDLHGKQKSGIRGAVCTMKITIIYRYFKPDTAPYALLLEKMVPWFVEAEHSINVIGAQPSYGADVRGIKTPSKETVLGASVTRLPLFAE